MTVAPLFAPRDRPNRVRRATERCVRALVIDLEDESPPRAKAASARELATTAVLDRAGLASLPVTEQQLRAKFDECVTTTNSAVVEAACNAIHHLLDQASAADVSPVVAALRPTITIASA
ncbi:hypothetical protein R3Q08_31390 [Rhodococcus erythropolis]|uniref:hypothetical protein n=1 Tax=Rhodococcus erythropolis TaxID=1833 RepID=UPI00294A5627|nr:hypothetical protein [Rhodococcus erythropolis]MDV6212760.1 hypothetical protein [Rhodococcus erythropolis]